MSTRIVLEYDGRNSVAKSIVNMIKSVGVFRVVEHEKLPAATKKAVADTRNNKGRSHKNVDSLMHDLMN
jgi:hypothetical protein